VNGERTDEFFCDRVGLARARWGDRGNLARATRVAGRIPRRARGESRRIRVAASDASCLWSSFTTTTTRRTTTVDEENDLGLVFGIVGGARRRVGGVERFRGNHPSGPFVDSSRAAAVGALFVVKTEGALCAKRCPYCRGGGVPRVEEGEILCFIHRHRLERWGLESERRLTMCIF